MAEKTTHDESMAALRARIKHLEAALDRERDAARSASKGHSSDRTSRARESRHDADDTSRRVTDSATAVTRRARDGASRMVRGSTLAAFEGLRAFSDSITSFADGVISRNEGSDRNVRDLITDLPGDIASGFADAFDNFIDVPSRAADRYSKSYREGSDTPVRKRSRDDDDESPATHAAHDAVESEPASKS
jgi:hypothetical protein